MDERDLRGRAPWWFRKLVDAETAHYIEMRKTDPMYGKRITNLHRDGSDPVAPTYEGDELTIAQKLAKYGIVREPGDDVASAKLARTRVPGVVIPKTPAPVPRLDSFMRDPENPRGEAPVIDYDDPYEFGG